MKRKLSIAVAGFFLTLSSHAQNLSDTIFFDRVHQIEIYDVLPKLDSTQILHSLTNPEGFIYKDSVSEFCIIIRKNDKWQKWNLYGQFQNFSGSIERVERVKIGPGKEGKMILHWRQFSGRSDEFTSQLEDSRGIQVWDLETKTQMLDVQTMTEYKSWNRVYQVYPEDSVCDDEWFIQDSDKYNFNFDASVKMGKRRIKINEIRKVKNNKPLALCAWEYRILKDGLVLRRKFCK